MSNTLTKLLAGAAVAATATVTTGALAKDAPTADTLALDGNTLIEKAETPKAAHNLKYKFGDLEYKAAEKAKYLSIQKLLPEIEKDINAWKDQKSAAWLKSHDPKAEKAPPLPESDNIKRLQGLLGIKGKAQDGVFGPDTSRYLTARASRSVGDYNPNDLPHIDINNHPSLKGLVREQAPANYAGYLEKLLKRAQNFEQELLKIGHESIGQRDSAVQAGFQHCVGEQIATDKDKFVKAIVTELDATGNIDKALSACQNVLKNAEPKHRKKLLDGLKEQLGSDIATTRAALKEVAEKAQLKALVEKYGAPARAPQVGP